MCIGYINKGRESIDMLLYIGKTLAMAVNSLNSLIFYEAVHGNEICKHYTQYSPTYRQVLRNLILAAEVIYEISKPI